MRVNRKFLYWGVFLVAIGGVVALADLGGLDTTVIRNGLLLWPFAIIAIGLGLVLHRTRFSLAGGLLAAAVPGLLLGGGFALAPRISEDCGAGTAPNTVATEQGVFDGPATVSVTTGCGSLVVDTAPGNAWHFEAGNTPSRTPRIDASGRVLTIATGSHERLRFFDDDRETWRLTLPTSRIEDLSIVVNAGEGRLALPGAQVDRLNLTTNAGSTSVDLSQATVTSIATDVNAGAVSFQLPAADLVGTFEVNAGGLEICIPDGVGLRVVHDTSLGGISINGLDPADADWQSPNYASATHHADLNIDVNFGGVDINPVGGCK